MRSSIASTCRDSALAPRKKSIKIVRTSSIVTTPVSPPRASWALAALGARLPPPDRASVCSGARRVGLSRARSRPRAHGTRDRGSPRRGGRRRAFGAHVLAALDRIFTGVAACFAAPRRVLDSLGARVFIPGGSNAWATGGARSASGRPLLCGDPHLQINQQPAILCEVRARIGGDYWLGATIPGLPGLALGRNRNVAWSGTFACADNVDYSIEDEAGQTKREVNLGRRFATPLRLSFTDGARGSFMNERLCVRWAGSGDLAECLAAYLRLPFAQSAAEADTILARANTLSLHFVIADRGGDVRYRQVGRIPRRHGSGLYPRSNNDWIGFATLPAHGGEDDLIASANEARISPDGDVLATLPQPPYRLRRISSQLAARRDHDVHSMQKLQCDLFSMQHIRLTPHFLAALPEGALRDASALPAGTAQYGRLSAALPPSSKRISRRVSRWRPSSAGRWFEHMLGEASELSIWWCGALDGEIARGLFAERRERFVRALGRAERSPPEWHTCRICSLADGPHRNRFRCAAVARYRLAGLQHLGRRRAGHRWPGLSLRHRSRRRRRLHGDHRRARASTTLPGEADTNESRRRDYRSAASISATTPVGRRRTSVLSSRQPVPNMSRAEAAPVHQLRGSTDVGRYCQHCGQRQRGNHRSLAPIRLRLLRRLSRLRQQVLAHALSSFLSPRAA